MPDIAKGREGKMFQADKQLFCGLRHERAYAILRSEKQQQRLLGQRGAQPG